jgi:hypothetical protein
MPENTVSAPQQGCRRDQMIHFGAALLVDRLIDPLIDP